MKEVGEVGEVRREQTPQHGEYVAITLVKELLAKRDAEIERLTADCAGLRITLNSLAGLTAREYKRSIGGTVQDSAGMIQDMAATVVQLQKFNDAAQAECQRLRELPCAECAVLRERLQECEVRK